MIWSESKIEIREISSFDEFEACIELQREAFNLLDIELSPRRHFIVSRSAGGWTLGAFADGRMVGFVHHLVAVRGKDEITGYSHMMAVARPYQNQGVGAMLKWRQRQRAMEEGRRYIKWTWDPMQPRNAHFNLNRLGVVARSYAANYYGTDYMRPEDQNGESAEIGSDRLFAEWELDSDYVARLARGLTVELPQPILAIEIPPDWASLLKSDPRAAQQEQLRVREDFENSFRDGLVCRAFDRDTARPRYLLYSK
jgi:predicted GNAT superfamily acetyltransferase